MNLLSKKTISKVIYQERFYCYIPRKILLRPEVTKILSCSWVFLLVGEPTQIGPIFDPLLSLSLIVY